MSEEEADYVEVDESTKRQIEVFHKQYPIVSEDEIFHFIEKYVYNMEAVEEELHRIYGTEEKYKNLEEFNWNIVSEKKPKQRKAPPKNQQKERREERQNNQAAPRRFYRPQRGGYNYERTNGPAQRYQRGRGRGYKRTNNYQDYQQQGEYPQNTQNRQVDYRNYEDGNRYKRGSYRQPMRRQAYGYDGGVRYQRRGRGRGYRERFQRKSGYQRTGYSSYGRGEQRATGGYRLKQKQEEEANVANYAKEEERQQEWGEENQQNEQDDEEDIYMDAGAKQTFYGNQEEEERPYERNYGDEEEERPEEEEGVEQYGQNQDDPKEEPTKEEEEAPQPNYQKNEPPRRREEERPVTYYQKVQPGYSKEGQRGWKKKEQQDSPPEVNQAQKEEENAAQEPVQSQTKRQNPQKEESQFSRNIAPPMAYPGNPGETRVMDAPPVVEPEQKHQKVPQTGGVPFGAIPPQPMGMHPMMMPGMPHPYMIPAGLPPMYPPSMMPQMMPHPMYSPGVIPPMGNQPQAKVGAQVGGKAKEGAGMPPGGMGAGVPMGQYMPMPPYYIGKGEGGQPIMYPPMYYMPMGNGKEGYTMVYPSGPPMQPMPEKKENPK